MNLDFSEFNGVISTGDELTGAVISSYEKSGGVHSFKKEHYSVSDKVVVTHKLLVSDEKVIYMTIVNDDLSQFESFVTDRSDEVLLMIKHLLNKSMKRSFFRLFEYLGFKFSRLN